ncbi:hypothetical protein HD806DRAFT_532167 [Xylariaceae sp. AK1471]|nr:hypothetical protein HD806DRAFT_532167 [Xylariaceae sp. AK1471]
MSASQQETPLSDHRGQLILWTSLRETIVGHVPRSAQHKFTSTVHLAQEVDNGAAKALAVIMLLLGHMLPNHHSQLMNLDEDEDAPYELDDFSEFQDSQSTDNVSYGYSKRKTVPTLKRNGSCLRPMGSPKKQRYDTQQSKVQRKSRKGRARTRFEHAIYKQGSTEKQVFKWIRRDDDWEVMPEIYEYDAFSLFDMDPGGLSIYVRAEAGDMLCLEWDEGRQKLVGIDIAGRREYRVSVEKMRSLLEKPRQYVEFKYWQNYH